MYSAILVDDESLFLDGFVSMIDWPSYGFEVIKTFDKAREALAFLKENSVNLVVTDIMMPGLDGLEFLRQLKAINPDIVTIILSGAESFEYAQKAIRFGVSNYLLKPLNVDELALSLMDIKEALDAKYDEEVNIGSFDGYYKDVVENIKKNVLMNYRTITLENIALDVKMSTNYVSKLFKKVSGQNFSDYLIEVKMTNAMRLLKNNELKIYEIAYMIGYDNPKNFTRAFKKYWGKSPWEYKENGFKE